MGELRASPRCVKPVVVRVETVDRRDTILLATSSGVKHWKRQHACATAAPHLVGLQKIEA